MEDRYCGGVFPSGFDVEVDNRRGRYSGYLIVRLRVEHGLLLRREKSIDLLRAVTAEHLNAPVPCRWLVTSVSPERLAALEKPLDFNEQPQLFRVARVDLRRQPAHLGRLLAALRGRDDLVDFAYAELAVRFEVDYSKAYSMLAEQPYLSKAPIGIGARGYWTEADLSRTRLVDIEGAWSLSHVDINNHKLMPLNSMNEACQECLNHGTSVLGVVAAKRNSSGGTGVAYKVPSIGLGSTYDSSDCSNENVASAIIAAVDRWVDSEHASVILLEVQRGDPFSPTEVDWCDWHAIHCACAHGMAVVECAGNGGTLVDLQSPRGPSDIGMMGRQTARGIELKDSGAIIVGAGDHRVFYEPGSNRGLHFRSPDSNFGTRVDCYAWGDGIYTTGFPDTIRNPGTPLNRSYRSDFGGTSGAAAIVAGATLLIQGVAWKRKKHFLPPQDLRQLIASFGTGQLDTRNPIGVMPDLDQILPHL
jgi:serine protease